MSTGIDTFCGGHEMKPLSCLGVFLNVSPYDTHIAIERLVPSGVHVSRPKYYLNSRFLVRIEVIVYIHDEFASPQAIYQNVGAPSASVHELILLVDLDGIQMRRRNDD